LGLDALLDDADDLAVDGLAGEAPGSSLDAPPHKARVLEVRLFEDEESPFVGAVKVAPACPLLSADQVLALGPARVRWMRAGISYK
jgi:hypothetical protein